MPKNPRSNKGQTITFRLKNHIYDKLLSKADKKFESITDIMTRLVNKEINEN